MGWGGLAAPKLEEKGYLGWLKGVTSSGTQGTSRLLLSLPAPTSCPLSQVTPGATLACTRRAQATSPSDRETEVGEAAKRRTRPRARQGARQGRPLATSPVTPASPVASGEHPEHQSTSALREQTVPPYKAASGTLAGVSGAAEPGGGGSGGESQGSAEPAAPGRHPAPLRAIRRDPGEEARPGHQRRRDGPSKGQAGRQVHGAPVASQTRNPACHSAAGQSGGLAGDQEGVCLAPGRSPGVPEVLRLVTRATK